MRRGLCWGLMGFAMSVSGVNAQNYGGGFIELLMTGRDPTAFARPALPRSLYGPAPYARDPYGRARIAALPSAPYGEERGIGRIMDPKYRRQTVITMARRLPAPS